MKHLCTRCCSMHAHTIISITYSVEAAGRIKQWQDPAVGLCMPEADRNSFALLQVLSAWRLVIQHRCWYEFACYLLVQSSMTALQAQGKQQQTRQQQQQQLQGQKRATQAGSDGDAFEQACFAAAFIAWVQEPINAAR